MLMGGLCQLTELGGRNVQESVTSMPCSCRSRVTSLAAFLPPSCCFFCFFDGSWSMGAGFTKGISSWRPGREEPLISQGSEPTGRRVGAERQRCLSTKGHPRWALLSFILSFPGLTWSCISIGHRAYTGYFLSSAPATLSTRGQGEFWGLGVNKVGPL